MTVPHTPSRVSVIVMTVDRPGALRRCLESVETQSLSPGEFEVILVDASTEPVTQVVADFADRLRLNHYVGHNLGVAGNRNTGVDLARGPVVCRRRPHVARRG